MTRQRGLSLIEMMISLIIGVMLVGSLIAVFVGGHRSFRQDLQLSSMQQSARHALRVLSEEVSMIGFMGDNMNPTMNAASVDSDCGSTSDPAWALDLTNTFQLLVNQTGTQAQSVYGCISSDDFVDNTDVLSIKRAEGRAVATTSLASEDQGTVFVSSSASSGTIEQYSGTNFELGKRNWRYLARIYYIRNESLIDSGDGFPSLYRKSLGYNTDEAELEVTDVNGGIARGIEYFHIEFGIDQEVLDGNPNTVPNGAPNFYTASPTAAQLAAAVTAKIYVLARSESEITGYTNNKVYTMGTASKGAFNDGHYRRVFSTVVRLRNALSQAYVNHIIEST